MLKCVIVLASGLLFTLAGMVITFIIAPPIPSFIIDGGSFNTPEEEAKIERSQKLEIAWSKLGVFLLVAGTVLQLAGTVWELVVLARKG
jgi:hypothetical protein